MAASDIAASGSGESRSRPRTSGGALRARSVVAGGLVVAGVFLMVTKPGL